MPPVLTCHRISKTYGRGALAETAVSDVSLSFQRGDACVLLGPSGSGKTTLLSMLGCLLTPTAGELQLEGRPIPFRSPGKLASIRRDKVGFIFQHAQLLPFLSVEENLRLVGRNAGMARDDIQARIHQLTTALGIAQYLHRKPRALSGGQRQRAAVARALVHRPAIVLADEPTAALDWHNGQTVVKLLIQQTKLENALLIVVTHDVRMVDLFDRVLHADSGKVTQQ